MDGFPALLRRSVGLFPRAGIWSLASLGAFAGILWVLGSTSGSVSPPVEATRSPLRSEVRRPRSAKRVPNDLTTSKHLLAADLQALDRLVRDNTSAARRAGEKDILASWAQAKLNGDSKAARAALDRAGEIAARLPPANGRLLAEGVRVIRRALSTGDVERVDFLARGHVAFAAGVSLHIAEDDARARQALDAAIRDLRRAESPLVLSARMVRLWADPGAGPTEIHALVSAADSRGFGALVAEGYRRLGWFATGEGEFDLAVDYYSDARERFEQLGEWEEAAVVRAMRAEILSILGRRAEAAFELEPAWQLAADLSEPFNRFTFWTVASSTALVLDSPLAFAYRQRAVSSCAALPERPLCGVDSWLGFARRSSVGELADRAFERAEFEIGRLPPLPGRARTEIELVAARARWLAREGIAGRDPERAADLLLEAAHRFQEARSPASAALALDDRAGILERLGRIDESRSESRRALALALDWGRGGSDASSHEAIPGTLRHLFERLIRLELARSESDASNGLLLSDEMRDRVAPRLGPNFRRFEPADLQRLLDSLPPHTAVVEYALVAGSGTGSPPSGMAWVLARGRLDRVTLTAGGRLAECLAAFRKVRSESLGLEAWRASTGAFYIDWVAPVLAVLPAGIERLVLIPDSELYEVPWRGLWNDETGTYLDEEMTVALAPSLGSLRLPANPNATERPIASVISVGFSRFEDLGLKDLPNATKEAREVYSGYPASVARCIASDWQAFRHCAEGGDVLHLATHAHADSRLKGGSWIAFGAQKVSDETLWRDLPALPRTRLVVLSACETASTSGGEGLGGLARPFLAHGVHAVVGTLWNLGDRTALELFPTFHRLFAQSEDAAESLRKGRAEWDGWERKPWKWAGAIALDTEMR